MKDERKTKVQLINELVELRQRVAELEALETERKRAEEALRESGERFRLLAENASTLVCEVDLEGRYLYANSAYKAFLGYEPEELIGRKAASLIHPDEIVRATERFQAMIEANASSLDTWRFRHKDGQWRWFSCSGNVFTKPSGEKRVVVVSTDITKRVQAEESLRESEERYRSLFEGAEDHIFVLDQDFRYVMVNPSALEASGFTLEDVVGTGPREAFPEDAEFYLSQYRQAFEAEKPVWFERELRLPDGAHWFSVTLSPIKDAQGQVTALTGISRDITERVRADNLIRTQRDMALALSAVSDLDEGLRLCLEAALHVSGMDCGGVYLVEEASGALDLVFHKELSPGFVRSVSHYDADSANARLVMAGQPVYTEHGQLGVPLDETEVRESLRALTVLPMHHKGRVIGCLNVASHTLDEVPVFSRDALETIAAQIGSAIARLKAEEALRRSLDETARGHRLLLALSQAAQAVERARTLDEVYRTVGDEVAKLGYHATIFTLTDDQAHLVVSHLTFEPAPLRAVEKLTGLSAQDYRFSLVPDGFFQRIIAEGETTFTERTPEHIAEALPELVRPLAGRVAALLGTEQSIVAPLTIGSETHGLLVVSGTDLSEAEQQRRHIAETLRQASTVLSSTLELDEVLALILQQLRQVIPYDSASVQQLWGERLEIIACQGFEEPDKVVGVVFPLDVKFPNYNVVTTKAPLAIEDIVQDYPHFKDEAAAYKSGRIRSWLGVPLMVKDRVKGMIAIDRAEVRPYTDEESQLAGAFANQAAIAIENAQLYQETVRRLREAEAVGAVTTTLTRSLDLDQVLQSIVDSAIRLVSASTGGVIHLVDEATGKLMPWTALAPEISVQEKYLEMSIGKGIAGLAVQEKRPINVPNVEKDPRFLAVDTTSPKKSLLTAPLLVDEDCIGTLSLNSDRVGAFSADDERLLATLAAQAAVAVKNARLFEQAQQEIAERKRAEEETRQRTVQLEAVREVGLELIAQLDLDALLHSIVSRAIELLEGACGGLYLYRPEQDVLEWAVSIGPNLVPTGTVLHRGEGLSGRVWETGQSLIVEDYQHWEGHAAIYEGHPWTAIVGVPVRWGKEFLGVLNVLADSPRTFSPADAELLDLFATQAAIALRNARLYEQVEARSRYLETLQQINATLRSTLPLSQVLEMIARGAGQALNYVGSLILIPDATGKRLTLGGVWGGKFLEAAVKLTGLDVASFSLPLTAEENPMARAYLNGELYAWNQAPERIVVGVEPAISPKLAPLIARTMGASGAICLPLPVGEKVVGVLVAISPREQVTDEERAMLLGLADQAGLAIENARLYEQARQDAQTKTILLQEVNHRVKNNLSAVVGLLYAERRYASAEDQVTYQSIIENMSNRVQGLAVVHSLLSASEWAPLSLSEVTAQVLRYSLQRLPRDKSISVDVSPSPVRVTPDQAHDLALVINELATNTVKHALQERDAVQITVRIGLEDDTVRFEFRDDGPGYSEEVLQLERHNVGFYLMQRVVRATLRGELALHNDRGAVTTLRFQRAPSGFQNPRV
jgi:PAS domain S-box-containing protein